MISLGINIGANSTVYANCGYDNNNKFFTKTLMNDILQQMILKHLPIVHF